MNIIIAIAILLSPLHQAPHGPVLINCQIGHECTKQVIRPSHHHHRKIHKCLHNPGVPGHTCRP